MKKQILNTIGLAAIAALLCVTCGDNGLDTSPKKIGDVDRFLGRINSTDTTGGQDTTGGGTPTTPVTYTLNVGRNNASGGSVSREPDKPTGYNPGETVTVKATPQTGFGFTGWSGAVTGTTNPVIIKMDGNKALTANFVWQDTASQQPDTTYELIVIASPAGSGSVSLDPDQSNYAKGATVAATATASTGYRFTGWSDAATGTANPVTITMDGNKTLTAEFVRIYTVTFNVNGGNTLTSNTATTGTDGKLASLPTPTRTNYTFKGWWTTETTGGDSVTVSRVYTANTTIYARWVEVVTTPTTYTLTMSVNPNNSGTTNPASSQANISGGTAVNISANPNSGYTFTNWTLVTGTATFANPNSASTTVTLSSNATVRANFTQSGGGTTYTLTVTRNPTDGGSTTPASPQSNISAGTAVNITATPASTYNFNNWTVTSGTATFANANSAATMVTLSSNATIRANFQKDNTPPSGNTFTDSRDGKRYKTVTIGGQTWMAENLNYDGKENGGSEKGVCYGNSAENCAKYGRLYNWSTAMGIEAKYNSTYWGEGDEKHQGVCPVGWHLPSDAEWTKLTDDVGGASTAGTKLKSKDGWNSYSGVPVGTDQYGFSALPGGSGSSGGSFDDAGNVGYWWSATEYDAYNASYRSMDYNGENVYWRYSRKTNLFSVRCAQD